MPHDPQNEPEAKIVIRLSRSRKGRYVAASRAAGKTLVGWIIEKLDDASPEIAPPPHGGDEGSDPARGASGGGER